MAEVPWRWCGPRVGGAVAVLCCRLASLHNTHTFPIQGLPHVLWTWRGTAAEGESSEPQRRRPPAAARACRVHAAWHPSCPRRVSVYFVQQSSAAGASGEAMLLAWAAGPSLSGCAEPGVPLSALRHDAAAVWRSSAPRAAWGTQRRARRQRRRALVAATAAAPPAAPFSDAPFSRTEAAGAHWSSGEGQPLEVDVTGTARHLGEPLGGRCCLDGLTAMLAPGAHPLFPSLHTSSP